MADYNYWDDLKTDLRRPKSAIDLANMLLRRVGLILVWHYAQDDPRVGCYRLHWWPRFCRERVGPIEQEGEDA